MSQEPTPDRPSIDAQLAALPRDTPPARDLWPGILASISAPPSVSAAPRRRWPLALAAGVAGAALLLGWQVGRVRLGAGAMVNSPSPGSQNDARRAASFAVPAGAEYLSARAALEHTYRERLEQLAPGTRERIEQDMTAIRAANADIRQALAADPQSAVLNHLLESTWQEEFDLYATVIRATAPTDLRAPT
jgi:hypothetical protein